jgi:uncharacterized protein YkwD
MVVNMAWRKTYLLSALLLAACSGEAAPERVVEPRTSALAAPRGQARLERTMLAAHNAARAEIGQPALRWNARLAADAGRYAAELARTRRFAHSPQPRGNPEQGENLWTGTRLAYRYEEMAGHWIAEKRLLRPGVVPNLSDTGTFTDVGHYTQIVWRNTTEVGCALASNATDDYLVCRYTPVGNVWGQAPF